MTTINYDKTDVDGLKIFYRRRSMRLSFCCFTDFRARGTCSAISSRSLRSTFMSLRQIFLGLVSQISQAPKLAPDNNGLIWLPENTFPTAFAQNASADDLAILAAVQRPLSINCITVPAGPPLWKDIPTWFLIVEQDRIIAPQTQRFMAERMKAKTKAHSVDHTPTVTASAVVVDIIHDAIRSVTGN